MLTVLRNTWPLFLGMLFLMVGNSLQGTLLGVRGSMESMSTSTLGYIMSMYFVGFLGGSQLTPLMIKQVGHIRVFAFLGSLVSTAFILYAALINPWAWGFLRLVVGFCFSGIYVVSESWLNHSATNENRGKTLSLYLIVQTVGMVTGQLMMNLGNPGGYDLFVLITVLVSLSFTPILLSTAPAPMHGTASNMSIPELIKTSPLATVSVFLLGGVFSNLFAMAPVYASSQGYSVSEISMFVSAAFAGGLVLQYPVGWISDKIDRRLLIIAVSFTGVIISIIGLLFSHYFLVSLLVMFCFGGVANPLYSLTIAYANDYLKHDQMSAASGGLTFLNGLGAMGSPILLGYSMSKYGNGSFFVFNAVFLALIVIYGMYRQTRRTAPNVSETGAWVPISSRSTVIATEMAAEVMEENQLEEEKEDTVRGG